MPRLLISGYFGYGNAGDEAILAAMLSDLRERFAGAEIVVASGDPSSTSARHGVSAVPRDDVSALSEAVQAADLVVLGGGGLIHDYWPTPREDFLTGRQGGLYAYLAIPVLAKVTNRPLLLYGVGVGPLRSSEGRRLARIAFSLAQAATVRDPESLALLREIELPAEHLARVEVAADPAFALRASSYAPEVPAADGGPLVGVALRPWDFARDRAGAWELEVAAALDRLIAERSARIVFLPFGSGGPHMDDGMLHERVRSAMALPSRTLQLPPRLAPNDLAAAIAGCDVALAMRYHAALFALRERVATVALAYDPKVAALMASAGLAEAVLPPERWSREAIHAALDSQLQASARRPPEDYPQRMREAAGRSTHRVAELLLDRAERPAAEADLFLGELTLQKVLTTVQLESDVERLRELAVRAERELTASGGDSRKRLAEERERRRRGDQQRRRLAEWIDHSAAERRALQEELRHTRADCALLQSDRDRLHGRLHALEGSQAIRLLNRAWATYGRLFPAGSRRRALYLRLRGLPAAQATAAPLTETAALEPEGAPPAKPSTDFHADLLDFEARVEVSRARRVVAIAAGTQMVESEGQRPTQLALDLARRGIPVVFLYFRWSKTDWRPQDRLDEGILQLPLDVVAESPDLLASAFASLDRYLLLELPHPSLFELLAAAATEGWLIVYDVLDDWSEFHHVGQAVWYDEPFERHVLTAADAVFAVNEVLMRRAHSLGARGAEVVGNGVARGIETVRSPRPLERGTVTVGYFGYLSEAWFDWELLAETARRRPSWRFYLIGYGGRPESVSLPDNVRLLGKQPQRDLAAYASNWDVALVPFKPGRLAAGADPIKTYEYLAMALPVVVTGVYPPLGAEDLVHRAETADEMVEAIERAAALPAGAAAERVRFAAASTWARRVDTILATLEGGRQRVAEKRSLVEALP